MRAASTSVRFALAALFAVLLAVRSLAPAGFMPSFDHGAVTIVACPDAGGPTTSMSMHHKGVHKSLHQPCPYASAASLGALGADSTALPELAFFVMALVLGRPFLFVERRSGHERPFLRGPPIPA